MRVLQRAALVKIEVLDVFQNKGWSRGGVGQLHVNEVGALHVFELNGGTQVFLHVFHLNVLYGQAFYMANEKAMGRQRAKAVRIGIDVFNLGNLNVRGVSGASAPMQDIDVAELNVF